MLEIRNLSHWYEENQKRTMVFAGFALKVVKGEIVSLVGPSGCGKTTLVNIIAGYLAPAAGEVRVNGRVVRRPGRDRIVMNQEHDLFWWMTVAENLQLVTHRRSAEVTFYLRLVGLEKVSGSYPGMLSGGMKKRLSLARALSANPEFIIMDEPFSSLDYQTREKLYPEMLEIIKSSGKTVLFVTHDIREAALLSDRIIVLSRGFPTVIVKEIPKRGNTPEKIQSVEEEIKKALVFG